MQQRKPIAPRRQNKKLRTHTQTHSKSISHLRTTSKRSLKNITQSPFPTSSLRSRVPFLSQSIATMSTTPQTTDQTTTITPRLKEVREQLKTTAARFNRDTNAVQLLAVSKTHPNDAILEAYNLGQRAFGENYVNELVEKAPALPLDIQWHFIGNLQSNKCKFLAQIPNLTLVESIDNIKLAGKLNTELQKAGWGKESDGQQRKMGVLVQVNTSDEDQKGGVWGFEQCQQLVQYIQKECPLLQFRGLMTIGKILDDDNVSAAPYFETLVEFRDRILEEEAQNVQNAQNDAQNVPALTKDNFILSMGMTHDFETAIEYGSTEIRVGTAIFGNRVYLNAKVTTVSSAPAEADTDTTTTTTTATPDKASS